MGANPRGLPKMEERVEALLQSQLKAVRQLFMEHREALIALAEALIERDEPGRRRNQGVDCQC